MLGVDPEFGASLLRLWIAAGSAALLVVLSVVAFFQPHRLDYILDYRDGRIFDSLFPGWPGFIPGSPFESFTVSGLSGMGFGGNAGPTSHPSLHLQNIYSFADDVYYSRGKHQLRFGTLINRFNQALTINSSTSYGNPVYSNIANFL